MVLCLLNRPSAPRDYWCHTKHMWTELKYVYTFNKHFKTSSHHFISRSSPPLSHGMYVFHRINSSIQTYILPSEHCKSARNCIQRWVKLIESLVALRRINAERSLAPINGFSCNSVACWSSLTTGIGIPRAYVLCRDPHGGRGYCIQRQNYLSISQSLPDRTTASGNEEILTPERQN